MTNFGIRPATSPSVIVASVGINVLGLALPIVLLQVYDRVIPNTALDTLLLLICALVTALVIDALLRTARAYVAGWTGAQFEHSVGCRTVATILEADLADIEKSPAGVHLDRLAAVDRLREFYVSHGPTLLIDLPFVIIYIGLIWFIARPIAAVPIVLLALFALASAISGYALRRAITARSNDDARRFSFIIELLSGMHTVKTASMEQLMLRRYEKLMESAAEHFYRSTLIGGLAQGLGALFSQLTMATVIAFGSLLVLDGRLTIGGLAACSLLSGRALQPLARAMGIWIQYQGVHLAHTQVREVLSMPARAGRSAKAIDRVLGAVSLRDLHFTHDARVQLLRGIDLEVAGGEAIGISGGNGAGKTTLLHLIRGVRRPLSGAVLIDGIDLAGCDPRSLAGKVAYLPQHATLMSGTIMENLTFFRGGEVIEEAMRLAARLGLDEFIARMPQGYETQIASAADDLLPGGVRQRVGIIRALVDHPQIILFDEANTALDQRSDDKFKQLLQDLRREGRTLVLVSHRPSLLNLADRIYDIVDGKLVERPARASAPVAAVAGAA